MTKNVSSAIDPAILRKSVQHLMVELEIMYGQNANLAMVLTNKTGKKISRSTLAMALSGYRQSLPYAEYLSALKDHLEECLRSGANPVTVYTETLPCQYPRKGE